MKKAAIVPMLVLISQFAQAGPRLLFSIGGTYMRPADTGYRTVYGNAVIYPEFTGWFKLYKGVYVQGSFGQFAKKGTTPDLGLATTSKQSFYSIGLGMIGKLSGNLRWELEGGVAGITYREEGEGAWIRGRRPGYKADAGLLLMGLEEQIFVGLKVGYLASEVKDLGIKLGGLRAVVSFGVQLFGD